MPQYKFRAKHLYATFPQCGDATKESALAAIVDRYDCEWVLVAHELHASGEPHLHCVVRFKDYFQTHDPHEFDHITGKHGNYQSPRSLKKVLAYCYKDGDIATHGDVPSPEDCGPKGSSLSLSARVAIAIRKGTPLREIRDSDEFCGFYLTNKRHCESLETEMQIERYKGSLKPFPGLPILWCAGALEALAPCQRRLNDWLEKNLQSDREFKQKQLYLWGPPGIGKTTLALELAEYFMIYYPPMDEDFYDSYADETTDLVILDEFKAQKRITFLNQFLQGAPMTLRRKGSQVMKRKNVPVMIFSNFSLEQCYTHAPQVAIDALKERLEIIEWDAPTHVQLYLDGQSPGTPRYIESLDYSGAHAPDCDCDTCTTRNQSVGDI